MNYPLSQCLSLVGVLLATFLNIALGQTSINAWGNNDSGQTTVPVSVNDVISLAAGDSHSVAVRADGSVLAWGDNAHGQTNVPPGLSNAVTVSANGANTLALRADGTVVTWGCIELGGMMVSSTMPSGVSNVVAVAASGLGGLALRADGSVFAWGDPVFCKTMPQGLSNVVAIAAGRAHGLVLLADGEVVTWGKYDTDSGLMPMFVPPGLSNVVAVSAGDRHNVALLADGTVAAWGNINNGQTNVPPLLNHVVDIAAGLSWNLAVCADGSVSSWGAGEAVLNMPVGLSNVAVMATGAYHGLAAYGVGKPVPIPAVGQILAPYAVPVFLRSRFTGERPLGYQWEKNGTPIGSATNAVLTVTATDAGESGDYCCLASNVMGMATGTVFHVTAVPLVITAPPQQHIMFIGQGYTFSVGVSASGPLIYQWSKDGREINNATSSTYTVSLAKFSDRGAFSVSVRNPHGDETSAVANLSVVNVAAWGNASSGQTEVPAGLSNAVALAGGGYHSLALRTDGTLVSWGHYYNGWIFLPMDVPEGLSPVSAVSAGLYHSLALQSDGRLVAWGDNWSGQTNIPEGVSNAAVISANGNHCQAGRSDGSVVAWGGNYYGQTNVPSGLNNVVGVSAGRSFSLALRADGSVVAWGEYFETSLYYSYIPMFVPSGLSNVVAISAGEAHGLALLANGTVTAWGDNQYGQTDVPAGLSNVVAVSAGGVHSSALCADGSVTAWGGGMDGQRDVPTGLTNVMGVAAGGWHSLALIGVGAPILAPRPRQVKTVLGAPVFLYAQPAGERPIYCQWFKDGNPLEGATEPVWPVTATNVSQSGNYYCIASNAQGLATGIVVAVGYKPCVELSALTSATGMEMVPYTNSVAVTNGYPPYSLSLTGALPPGLTWSSEGVISGLPSMASTTLVSVTVADARGFSTNRDYEIVVAPNPNTRPGIFVKYPASGTLSMSESTGRVFRVYAYDMEGAELSYLWTWDGVPVGGNSSSYTRSTIWGDSGEHILRCYISDDLWTNSVFAQWSVSIWDIPLEITTSFMPTGMEMVAYSAELHATNGVAPYQWRVMPQVCGWGDDELGQTEVPPGLSGAWAVSAGAYHSLALGHTGVVVGWGDNHYGQLNVPAGLSNVMAISAGGYHNLARRMDGSVAAWGDNRYGQATIPEGLSNVIEVSAGAWHSLAKRMDGSVVVWGDNGYGQTNMPPGLSNVLTVSAGLAHSLAVRMDGTVTAWGDNSYGQTNVPPGLSNVVAVAAGGFHSLALRMDGTVMAWGGGWHGEADVPAGLSNVMAIAAGSSHSLALRMDGTVVAWGDDGSGQTSVPSWFSGVMSISAGMSHSLALRPIASHPLPEGLSCSSNGVVSGIPVSTMTTWITLVVQDSLGISTNRFLPIMIAANPNTRPVITSTVPETATVSFNDFNSRVFSIGAYDPEGAGLTYFWYWDGALAGHDLGDFNYTATWRDAGQHDLRCFVSDGVWSNVVYAHWQVSVFEDSDGDGIPDAWETLFFGNLTTVNATSDHDGDGSSDYAEFVAGTNPTNPASCFAVTGMPGSGANEFVLQWGSVSNKSYSISRTPDLQESLFGPIATNLPATPPLNTYTDRLEGVERAFYEIHVVP